VYCNQRCAENVDASPCFLLKPCHFEHNVPKPNISLSMSLPIYFSICLGI
jgi:hypothetical protein